MVGFAALGGLVVLGLIVLGAYQLIKFLNSKSKEENKNDV